MKQRRNQFWIDCMLPIRKVHSSSWGLWIFLCPTLVTRRKTSFFIRFNENNWGHLLIFSPPNCFLGKSPLFNNATCYFAILTRKANQVDTIAKTIGFKQAHLHALHVLREDVSINRTNLKCFGESPKIRFHSYFHIL